MARKLGLSRPDVVEAAANVADAAGLEGVTLAAVADRLHVRSPSLYAHVEGLEGLRRQLALEAYRMMRAALGATIGDRHGLDALRALAAAYRSFALAHAGLYDAAQRGIRGEMDEEMLRAFTATLEPAFRAIEEAGVGGAERVHLVRAVRSALHGFVLLERGGGFGLPDSLDESFSHMVDLLVAGVEAAAARSRSVSTH